MGCRVSIGMCRKHENKDFPIAAESKRVRGRENREAAKKKAPRWKIRTLSYFGGRRHRKFGWFYCNSVYVYRFSAFSTLVISNNPALGDAHIPRELYFNLNMMNNLYAPIDTVYPSIARLVDVGGWFQLLVDALKSCVQL